nr:EOG090X0A8N [Eurycercus lamellatus]
MAGKNLFGRNRKIKKVGLIVLIAILPLSLLALVLHLKIEKNKGLDSSELVKENNNSLGNSSHQPILLAVLIVSDPTKSATRRTIRETWLSLSDSRVKHFFVIGSKGLTSEVLQDVNDESATFNDLLILDSVAESYYTLTNKVLSGFQWVVFNHQFNFILKCDDDSYVKLPLLLDELAKQPQKQLYWGFFKGGSTVFRNGKWSENDWFVCDTYLPYALGGGYILSQDLVEYLANNAPLLQQFKSEDVSVGLWLSPLKIHRVHDVRFNTEYKSRGCFNSYLITHKQSANEMREMHSNLVRTGELCSTEIRLRYSYNYNWTAPPTKCCKDFDPELP